MNNILEVKSDQVLKLGDWEFDVFLTSQGALGFTVYEKGTTAENEDGKSKDIFVFDDPEMSTVID